MAGWKAQSTCLLFYNGGESINYIKDKGSNLSLYKEEAIKE